jgi:hypothetical protein
MPSISKKSFGKTKPPHASLLYHAAGQSTAGQPLFPPDVTRDRGSRRPRRDLKGAACQDVGSGLFADSRSPLSRSWIQGSSGQVRGGLQPVGQVLDRRRLHRFVYTEWYVWKVPAPEHPGGSRSALEPATTRELYVHIFLPENCSISGLFCSRCTLRLFWRCCLCITQARWRYSIDGRDLHERCFRDPDSRLLQGGSAASLCSVLWCRARVNPAMIPGALRLNSCCPAGLHHAKAGSDLLSNCSRLCVSRENGRDRETGSRHERWLRAFFHLFCFLCMFHSSSYWFCDLYECFPSPCMPLTYC